MNNSEELRLLISKLQQKKKLTRKEFTRAYRLLSKYSHPDLTSSDGELFIRLGKAYERGRTIIQGRSTENLTTDFTGVKFLHDYGYPSDLPPEIAFHILIQQYFQKGIYRKKVYQKTNLFLRNRALIDAINHWSGLYKPDFVEIFRKFRSSLNLIFPLRDETQQYILGQRNMVRGILACTWYHENGKDAHRSMSIDRLSTAAFIYNKLSGFSLPIGEMLGIIAFFREELENPPYNFSSYQGFWGQLQIL